MTYDSINWFEIRKHLIKSDIKVAKQACCPGCSDMSNNKIDVEVDTYVFIRTRHAQEFNQKRKGFYLCWNGDGDKIVKALQKLPLDVYWDGYHTSAIQVKPKDECKHENAFIVEACCNPNDRNEAGYVECACGGMNRVECPDCEMPEDDAEKVYERLTNQGVVSV